jgi:hypothetical protein
MAVVGRTGAGFKEVSSEDIVTKSSTLNQLVDVIQEDVSGSVTRRKYQVFVTGGIGPGVTSSLFQTVYDQDFTLQTANPIFDMTVGLFVSSTLVVSSAVGDPVNGKMLFPSQSLMMREKTDIYRQYAAALLGNPDQPFFAPFGSTDTSTTDRNAHDRIDEALFVSFKRLFSRDRIKRETFAMRVHRSGVIAGDAADNDLTETEWDNLDWDGPAPDHLTPIYLENVFLTSNSGSAILTDLGAASNIMSTFGGEVGNIVNAANTNEVLGLMFYEHGTAVLDMSKLFWTEQYMSGVIDAMEDSYDPPPVGGALQGKTLMGSTFSNFLVSGSVDQVIDHLASTRFGDGSLTAFTFQNVTSINSTLIFCRATADEFNYSSNPTYKDENGRIRVIDVGQEDTQRSFSFVTTVGLHDEQGRLLAVAKLSRPIEKNDERDLTVRVRLDF